MIHLNQIVKTYADTTALDQISLEIAQGDLVTLIGPSGCGKSTLLRIINRMIEPTSGEVMINGLNALQHDPVQLRRSIGYVIQNAGLFPHLNVIENVEMVTSILGWDKKKRRDRALELLDVVGLAPKQFASRYPKELSGGQQQRVGIARALAANPEVLLMDEPFSAVDPLTREQLQTELLRIQSEVRKTIVFVTHDIQEAIRLGDKVALMQQGKIVQYASPEVLLKSPVNAFAEQFLGQERALQRLGLYQVKDLIQAQSLNDTELKQTVGTQHSISLQSNARNALSQLLAGAPALVVVNDQQQPVAQLTLNDFVR